MMEPCEVCGEPVPSQVFWQQLARDNADALTARLVAPVAAEIDALWRSLPWWMRAFAIALVMVERWRGRLIATA